MLVSVIIPTYNRASTIVPVIESVLEQTYKKIEVIVVDDGSSDGTEHVLKNFGDRISVIRQENAGPSAARNRGVAVSKGEIVAFLDSDDHWMPDKIERQVSLMGRLGPDVCCCVCNAWVRGTEGEDSGNTFDSAGIRLTFIEGQWTNPQDVLATRFLLFNQVVAVRREAFDRVGGFNEALRLLEDYELAVRLASVGAWGVISDPLVIKHNETWGIGMECMMDRAKHARVCTNVIAGLIDTVHDLGPLARLNFQRTLCELKTESRALDLIRRGGLVSLGTGHTLEFLLRMRRAVRRRSPSWPKFEGVPSDVDRNLDSPPA
jgi:glycosyltransferase involved in cell wall biosynthesis